MARHPDEALFEGERPFPILPPVDHYAGTERRILRALEMQEEMDGAFDTTMDLEDGAPEGGEREHAELVAELQRTHANRTGRLGVRMHDYTHPHWRADVEIVVPAAGDRLGYIAIPKTTSPEQGREMILYIQQVAADAGIDRQIPIHMLIETLGGLHHAWDMARLPNVEVLDFGLMDLVAAHHGAIPSTALRSPGQFQHMLLRRAKAEVAAAALANGVVPAHNVTLDLRNPATAYWDARRGREEFGYLRQWSIHPAQIEPILRAMAPAMPEVEEAEGILLKAQEGDWGPIEYEGTLHDRATYRYFWEQLQRAHVMRLPISAQAKAAFFSAPVGETP